MNWVDLVVIALVGLSCLLALYRGLLREVLGVGAWIAAAVCAFESFHFVQPQFRGWISSPDTADAAAFGSVFVITLVVLSVVANVVGGLVRGSVLGGVNRTLGMVFGLLRGAALVIFAYILAGSLVEVDRWPAPVLQARTLPLAFQGSVWAVGLLPADWRPKVYPPPAGRDTRAADLLHANPAGRAIDRN